MRRRRADVTGRAYHPLLVALFPALSLYSHNVGVTSAGELWLPAVVLLLATVAVGLCAWLVSRDMDKAAIITTVAAVCFWSYTPLSRWATRATALAPASAYVPWAWLALVLVVVIAISRTKRHLDTATRVLNVTATCVTLAALTSIGWQKATQRVPATASPAGAAGLAASPAGRPAHLPDIYLVVLDSFGRSDVLKERYDMDWSLADALEALGFYVARESSSNYNTTLHSIPSVLNFDYLQDLLPAVGEATRNGQPLVRLVCDNAVMRYLRPLGYTFVAYSSGYYATECPRADAYVRPPWLLTEFQMELLNMTPLALAQRGRTPLSPYRAHRRRITESFERLAAHAGTPGPRFVFVHMVTPHYPYVFGENGEDVSPYDRPFRFNVGRAGVRTTDAQRAEHTAGYRGQATYVSKMVRDAVAEILRRSPEPPVIIVQGDHGPSSGRWGYARAERYAILNAYYLPHGGAARLYPTISPVNSFRVVLDHYFDAGLPLLPDRRYFTSYDRPFRFVPAASRPD